MRAGRIEEPTLKMDEEVDIFGRDDDGTYVLHVFDHEPELQLLSPHLYLLEALHLLCRRRPLLLPSSFLKHLYN